MVSLELLETPKAVSPLRPERESDGLITTRILQWATVGPKDLSSSQDSKCREAYE